MVEAQILTTCGQVDLDPDGDLILLAGLDEQQAIRVCSKVLRLASPVFAALSNPRYAEGQALSQADLNCSTVPTISLPEDDFEAMVLICKVIHFQYTLDLKLLTLPLLQKVAVLCDKYDLSRALASWSRGALQKMSLPCKNDLAKLWISYALNQDDGFWEVSRELIRSRGKLEKIASSSQSLGILLPESLLGA